MAPRYRRLHGRGSARRGVSTGKQPIDRAGQKFGRLTAIRIVPRRPGCRARHWECRCDCGAVKEVSVTSLVSGGTVSCGCLRAPDLSGRRYGRLLVLGRYGRGGAEDGTLWSCRCDCGTITRARAKDLGNGNTASCGCLRGDAGRTYGNPASAAARRGRNLLTVDGVTKPLADWLAERGLSYGIVWCRRRRGWPVERLLEPRSTRKSSSSPALHVETKGRCDVRLSQSKP